MNGTVPRANIGRFGGFTCSCSITLDPGRDPNRYWDSLTEWNIGVGPASACATCTSTVCRDFDGVQPGVVQPPPVPGGDGAGSSTGFVKTADGLGGIDRR